MAKDWKPPPWMDQQTLPPLDRGAEKARLTAAPQPVRELPPGAVPAPTLLGPRR
jgi:hypothetical protein